MLSTFGIAPDEEMDGATPLAVEGVEPESHPEFETAERMRTDDESVEERLADLDYLE